MIKELYMNLQPIEKQVTEDTGLLDVVDVFPTIQGEGPYVGMPATFVRLAGCNLQCPGCDTDYTSKRQSLTPSELFCWIVRPEGCVWEETRHHYNTLIHRLVVITGGEPFRQRLGPIISKLVTKGFRIQIETNGTLLPLDIPHYRLKYITIVCSPKTKVNKDMLQYITHWKYILRAGEIDSEDGLPTRSLLHEGRPERPPEDKMDKVFVQPYDEKHAAQNQGNLKACIESCMKFGYRLSLQTHKIIGMP